MARFDQVCEAIPDRGLKLKQKSYLAAGRYPVIDQGEELVGGYTDDESLLFGGRVPVIAFGDHTRRFKLVNFPFALGADGVKLIAPDAQLDAKGIWYFFCALRFTDRGYSRHFQFVRDASIPIPPADEQRRIADKLDELLSDLDAGVKALEGVQAKLKQYRAAVLKAAMEGALTAEWRAQHPDVEPAGQLLDRILVERRRRWEESQLKKFADAGKTPPKGWREKYKEPLRPKSPPYKLPPTWCWATVEEVSTKVVDGVHKKPNYVESGVPFVTVRNLTAGPGISFEKLNYVSPRDHAEFVKRADPERGDILVSKDGTLGVIREIKTGKVFSIFVSVAMIKPVDRSSSTYLALSLQAPQVQLQMVPKGSGLVHIHLEDLREDCVPLSPAAEQAAIVEAVESQLSVIDHLESDLDAKLKSAMALRQSILKAAFEGKLVPQDPTDEPAGELLKRIAAERAERERLAKEAKAAAKKVAKPARAGGPRRGRKAKATKTGEAHGLFNDR